MGVVLHLANGAHLAAMAQAGGSGLASWVARDASEGPRRDRILRRLAGFGVGVALLLQVVLLAAHAWEVLQAPSLDLAAWLDVARHTWVGRVLLAQSAGLLLVGAGVVLGARLTWVGGAAALCIAVGALASHAAADDVATWTAAACVLHVAVAALWFGSLPCLLVAAVAQDRCNADPLVDMLRRFSRLALPAMGLILLTGVALAVILVGGQGGLFGTAYGATLLAKLACVGGALGCAAWLRRRLGAAGPPPPRLRRWLVLEAACALCAILLAGLLANLEPGAHATIVWPWPVRIAPWSAWQTVPGAAGQMTGAGVSVALASAVLVVALWRHRRRIMVGALAASAVSLGIGLRAMAVPAYATTYAHTPVPFDAAIVAAGNQTFRTYCTGCHGVTGRGDGPAAKGLVPRPADLTAPHVGWHTHGDLYWWITHGMERTAMPAFGDVLDERLRWSVIDYLIALSLGHEARGLGAVPVPGDPWLPSIDFGLPDGSTLATLRGQEVVVLFAADRAGVAEARRTFGAASLQRPILLVAAPDPLPSLPPGMRLVPDGDGHIRRAWWLYRRTLTHPDFADREPPPSLLGVLVDRFGFVRARWRGDEDDAPSVESLAEAVQRLAREPQIASVDEHAH